MNLVELKKALEKNLIVRVKHPNYPKPPFDKIYAASFFGKDGTGADCGVSCWRKKTEDFRHAHSLVIQKK